MVVLKETVAGISRGTEREKDSKNDRPNATPRMRRFSISAPFSAPFFGDGNETTVLWVGSRSPVYLLILTVDEQIYVLASVCGGHVFDSFQGRSSRSCTRRPLSEEYPASWRY